MENLLLHCANTLCRDYSVTVVGPKGCAGYLHDSIEVHEVPSRLIGFVLLAPCYALVTLVRRKFDIIFGGSGLVGSACWLLGKVFGAVTICYVHGLDIVVNSRIYQSLFVPSLRRLDLVIVNSSNTQRLCIEAGIDRNNTTIIHPGCDVPAVVDRPAARGFLREKHGIVGEFYLLFVGRIAPRKGLLAFMRQGFAQLLRQYPDTVLVIAGDSPDDSLAHRSDELVNVLRTIEENRWTDRVFFLGKVDHDTLSRCYAGADCLLFPLVPVAGDVEGFGMVAIEAAAHGTQTVAFSEGGVSDAVNHGVSGFLVPSGDYGAMVATLGVVATDGDTITACRNHARQFSWDVFDTKLLRAFDAAISE